MVIADETPVEAPGSGGFGGAVMGGAPVAPGYGGMGGMMGGMGLGMGMGAPGTMGGARFNPQDAMCGGTIDHTNPAAPKDIVSRVLTSFETNFIVHDPQTLQTDGYWFELKRLEDETYELTTYGTGHRAVTGLDTALAVRDIMDKRNLIALNGISRVTQGLPAEFQAIFLRADFVNGEHLHFCMNGHPHCCDWGLDLKRLFAKVFAEAGDPWLELPAEARRIARFHMQVSKGPIDVDYGVITFPSEEKDENGNWLPDVQRYFRMAYDTQAKCSAGEVFMDYDPELFERLQPVIEAAGLDSLPKTDVNFSRGSDPGGRVDLFIDYANRRQIYRQYRGAEIPPEWPAMQEAICGFLDAEFDAKGYTLER